MPLYTLEVTITTDETDADVVAAAVLDVIDAAPDTLEAIGATLTDESENVIDLLALSEARPTGPAPSVSVPASKPEPDPVDPANPPEESIPTGKEF